MNGNLFAAWLAAVALMAAPAAAQVGSFELELNNAADVPEGCRLTYVATNNTGVALEKTAFEAVVFDAEGAVSQIVVLEFGALPLGKTRVLQFDLASLACPGISRILVNGAVDCASAASTHDVCLKDLIASSRLQEIRFGL